MDQDKTVSFFTIQFAWPTENIHFAIKAASKPILKWAEKSKSETMTHSDLVSGKFKFHQHTLSPSNSKIISISNFTKDADMTVSTSFPVQSKATTNVKADSVAQNLDQEWDYIRLRHSYNQSGHTWPWVTTGGTREREINPWKENHMMVQREIWKSMTSCHSGTPLMISNQILLS